jgi:hypothetical protein
MRELLLFAAILFGVAVEAQETPAGRSPQAKTAEPGTLRWHAQQARDRGKTRVTIGSPVGIYANVQNLDEALSIFTVAVVEPVASMTVATDSAHIATWHKLRILERLNTHPLPQGDGMEIPRELQPVGPQEVVVRVPGGTVNIDGIEITSEDKEFPPLVSGRKYVAFLRPDASGKYALLQLGSKGIYTVSDSKMEPLLDRPNPLQDDIRHLAGDSIDQLRAVVARRAAH